MASKAHIRVVAALLWRDGQLLVQQRPAHKALGLLWEFPGGKVEPGESDAQALARECTEELGAEVQVGALAWQTSHDYAHGAVDLVVYTAHWPADTEPQAHAAAQVRWVKPAELGALPFCPADEPLVQDLMARRLSP